MRKPRRFRRAIVGVWIASRRWLVAMLLAGAGCAAYAQPLFVPDDFPSIQAAIDAAVAGETVVVAPGLYTENITLRSGVDVRGEEAALTLLRAAELAEPIVHIIAVDDVLFGNFTLLDSDDGIRVDTSDDVIIANNIFDTLDGIAVNVDTPSIVDVHNNVFFDSVVAVQRGSIQTWIFNNIFARNIQTITSSAFADLNSEVRFNCFFDNDDLKQGSEDTALGTNFQIGDPLFVDISRGDFHLQLGSPCIDTGTGTDVIDDTVADIGAYGGPFADPWPFPVPLPSATDTSAVSPPPFSIELSWEANLDYRVANPADPGSYRVYYRLNEPGPPYDGTDAGDGTQPSPIEVGDVTSFELTDLAPSVTELAPPQLVSAEPRNAAVVLDWAAVPAAIGYRVFHGVDAVDENETDVGDVDSHTVTGLTNGVEYLFAVVALNQPTYHLAVTVLDNTPDRHESVFSDEQTVPVGEIVQGLLSNQLAATPNETLPSPDLPDGDRCFIATAAYTSPWAPEVLALRDFRDRYLRPYAVGRRLVAGYYALSPRLAGYVDRHAGVRPFVQAALLPVVAVALFMLEAAAVVKAMLAVLLLIMLGRRWRLRGVAGSDHENEL